MKALCLADEAASKAAWILDHGATNENANLAHTVIALREALAAADLLDEGRETEAEIGRLLRYAFTAGAWRKLSAELRTRFDKPGPLQADTIVFDKMDRIADLLTPQPEREP